MPLLREYLLVVEDPLDVKFVRHYVKAAVEVLYCRKGGRLDVIGDAKLGELGLQVGDVARFDERLRRRRRVARGEHRRQRVLAGQKLQFLVKRGLRDGLDLERKRLVFRGTRARRELLQFSGDRGVLSVTQDRERARVPAGRPTWPPVLHRYCCCRHRRTLSPRATAWPCQPAPRAAVCLAIRYASQDLLHSSVGSIWSPTRPNAGCLAWIRTKAARTATRPRRGRHCLPGTRKQPDIRWQHACYEAIRDMVRGQLTSG